MPIVDQDRPSSWIPYFEKNCRSCRATCCTMPVEVRAEDFVRLGIATEDEARAPKKLYKRLKREGVVRSYRAASGLYLLEQKNGRDCYFLGNDRRCTVYERRPGVCRDFPASVGPRLGFCPYLPKQAGNKIPFESVRGADPSRRNE